MKQKTAPVIEKRTHKERQAPPELRSLSRAAKEALKILTRGVVSVGLSLLVLWLLYAAAAVGLSLTRS